jgi:hypothetical protein
MTKILHDHNNRGSALLEISIAFVLFGLVSIGCWTMLIRGSTLLRSHCQRSIVSQILDGEMEMLKAGEWRAFPPGVHIYPVDCFSASSLPDGAFTLRRDDRKLVLEWKAVSAHVKMQVRREMNL